MGICDVADDAGRPVLPERNNLAMQARAVDVGHDDLHAGTGERLRDAETDTARGTGDDGGPVLQLVHRRSVPERLRGRYGGTRGSDRACSEGT